MHVVMLPITEHERGASKKFEKTDWEISASRFLKTYLVLCLRCVIIKNYESSQKVIKLILVSVWDRMYPRLAYRRSRHSTVIGGGEKKKGSGAGVGRGAGNIYRTFKQESPGHGAFEKIPPQIFINLKQLWEFRRVINPPNEKPRFLQALMVRGNNLLCPSRTTSKQLFWIFQLSKLFSWGNRRDTVLQFWYHKRCWWGSQTLLSRDVDLTDWAGDNFYRRFLFYIIRRTGIDIWNYYRGLRQYHPGQYPPDSIPNRTIFPRTISLEYYSQIEIIQNSSIFFIFQLIQFSKFQNV